MKFIESKLCGKCLTEPWAIYWDFTSQTKLSVGLNELGSINMVCHGSHQYTPNLYIIYSIVL